MLNENIIQNKLHKYGCTNTYDIVKFIAISIMILDHIGLFFYPEAQYLRAIGRISFPLFFFLLGFNTSHKIPKELIILAIAMSCAQYYVGNILPLNILFSAIIAKFMLGLCKTFDDLIIFLIIPFLVLLGSATLFIAPFIEYGSFPVLFAIIGYLNRTDFVGKSIYNLVISLLYLLYEAFIFKFSIGPLILSTTLMLGAIYLFNNFKIMPIKIYNNKFNTKLAQLLENNLLILLFSRYSIYVFTSHYILFAMIKRVM